MSNFYNTAQAYLRALLSRMRGLSVDFESSSVSFGYENVFDAFVGATFEVKGIDVVDAARALGNAISLTEISWRIPLITRNVERLWRTTTAVDVVFYNPDRVDAEVAEIVFGVLRQAFSVDESEPLVLANAELRDGLLYITLAPKDGHRLPDFAWFKKTLSGKYIDLFGGKKINIRHQGNSVTIFGKLTTKE